jgi:DNA-binding XRE family transcriptional regulator
MPDDELTPTPGKDLAKLRRTAGIGQVALAQRLGMHRVTLSLLENAPEVDVLKSARYRRAVFDIVAEATEVPA